MSKRSTIRDNMTNVPFGGNLDPRPSNSTRQPPPETRKYGQFNVIVERDNNVEEFICQLCSGLLVDPLQTKCCLDFYCKECIKNWSQQNGICPEKETPPHKLEILPFPKRMLNMLNKIKIRCSYEEEGCPKIIRYGDLNTHLPLCEYRPNQLCSQCKQIRISVRTHNRVEHCLQTVMDKLEITEDSLDISQTQNSDLLKKIQELECSYTHLKNKINNDFKNTILKLKNQVEALRYVHGQNDTSSYHCETCGQALNVSDAQEYHPCLDYLVQNLIELYNEHIEAHKSAITSRDEVIKSLNGQIVNEQDRYNKLNSLANHTKLQLTDQILCLQMDHSKEIGEFNDRIEQLEARLHEEKARTQFMHEQNEELREKVSLKAKITSDYKTKLEYFEQSLPESTVKFIRHKFEGF